ncbi:MAG TPA: ATP-binding protein [Jiangellaceae bacterium]|nr:ATP-binding protein [Jiangellaceae bacterium]
MSGDPGREPAATVLVVEDSLINRLALARGVENEGHRVLQASDGREALEILGRDGVEMVLLDLLMPEVDGFEVLAAMGRDPALREIPVLVISAVEANEDIARAIEMGAIDCLPKPFDPVMLRVRLRTALEQARLRRVEQDYLRQELALRQQERLATLGRLSAGLGHELNNPAAAALSTARRLAGVLHSVDTVLAALMARPDAPRIVAALAALPTGVPADSAADREDRMVAVETVLRKHGLAEPWKHADALVVAGVRAGDLEPALAELGDGADAGLAWFGVRAALTAAVAQITDSVGRIAELTSALRSYSYLDRAPQQEVDVRRGLDDTLTILDHKRPAGVTVVREYADDLPAIHAYGGQLNQVWTNLLDNAIDAVGETGRVTVRVRPDGEGVVVEVADDGPGIPEDLQGRVFDPFVTTKPPGQGTGLGLNISHQIITGVHGGRLTLRSRPGDTVFTVRLPARPPDPVQQSGPEAP